MTQPPSAPRRFALLPVGLGLLVLAALAWWLWPRDPFALPGRDWSVFRERFVASDGRVVDTGNGNISHSEGQGYGMLLAVAYRDRATFDRMWDWTRRHLHRPDDALFSWKWEPGANGTPGKIGDPNNASDGDLLIAWALERAFTAWGDYRYQSAAAQIVISLFDKTTVDTYLGLQFLPGVIGFEKPEGVVVNPSYYVFPAFAELATAFPAGKWRALKDGGHRLLATARFGKWSLSPDWVLIARNWVDLPADHAPEFGYNAIRVPLHVAWQDPASPLLAPFAAYWDSLPATQSPPGFVNLRTDQPGPHPALPGMLAVRQLTLACVKKAKITVRDIPPVDKEEPYYSASLKMLTKLAIHDRFAPKRN